MLIMDFLSELFLMQDCFSKIAEIYFYESFLDTVMTLFIA